MSDGYMSRQRDIIISTYRYFFTQEWAYLTYFEKKSKYEERTTGRPGARIRCYNLQIYGV